MSDNQLTIHDRLEDISRICQHLRRHYCLYDQWWSSSIEKGNRRIAEEILVSKHIPQHYHYSLRVVVMFLYQLGSWFKYPIFSISSAVAISSILSLMKNSTSETYSPCLLQHITSACIGNQTRWFYHYPHQSHIWCPSLRAYWEIALVQIVSFPFSNSFFLGQNYTFNLEIINGLKHKFCFFQVPQALWRCIFCANSFFFQEKVVYLQHPMIKGLCRIIWLVRL